MARNTENICEMRKKGRTWNMARNSEKREI
jgi:hypothetical protein